ncbi:MAG: tetratricopeptide repeat protein [Bacteroidales bacterium]
MSVRRLKEALTDIQPLVAEAGKSTWSEELGQIDTTYRYMLDYTTKGIPDPERDKVYRKVIADLYELADRVAANLLLRESTQYVYVRKRIFRDDPGLEGFIQNYLDNPDLSNPESTEYLRDLSRLFHYVWLTDEFRDREVRLVELIRDSGKLSVQEKAVIVTGLNLGLLRYFDRRKFDLLFSFFNGPDEEVRQRALIGLLLAFFRYDQRLTYYPGIRGRLLIMDEDPQFKKLVQEVITQLIRSRDSDQLSRRMQEEILPEMIKLTPQIRNKLDLDKLLGESLQDDQNPEWEELFGEAPGLRDKMQELTELQMEGDDVFLGTFRMLKGFPFFRHLINWFFPFTPGHPEIKALQESGDLTWMTGFLESVEQSFYLCNSDKYSISFGIRTMPAEMQKFLNDGLRAEADQLKETLADEQLIDPLQQSRRVIRQYTQDLYRFYKLYPDHQGFDDPFTWKLDFYRKDFYRDLFRDDTQALYAVAGFYLYKKNYREAAEAFGILEQSGDMSAEVLQKSGFAWQKSGNYQKALDYYLKADLLLPENLWNLKKIGLCYRYLKQPDKALLYYRQAEHIDPEDLSTEVSIGHCLLDLQEYGEALKSYFKVEYLAPANTKVWRPIAWCSFLLGKLDQASDYYHRLLEKERNHYDLISLGHLEWCRGNRQEAIERYRESIVECHISFDEFLSVFEHDREQLVNQCVDPGDVPILLDHLRYLISG